MEWAKSVWWITILRLLLVLLGKAALSIGVSRGQDRHLDQLSCFHEGRNCLRASQRKMGKRRRLILMISIEPLKPSVYTIRIYFLLLVHISHSLFWRFRSSLMLDFIHCRTEKWQLWIVATFQFCITHGILRARNKVWKIHPFPGLRERGGFFYKYIKVIQTTCRVCESFSLHWLRWHHQACAFTWSWSEDLIKHTWLTMWNPQQYQENANLSRFQILSKNMTDTLISLY